MRNFAVVFVIALLVAAHLPPGLSLPSTVPAFLWSPHYDGFSSNGLKQSVNYQTLSPKDLAKFVLSEGGWSDFLCSEKGTQHPVDLALLFVGREILNGRPGKMQLKSHAGSTVDTKTLNESIQSVHFRLDDLFSSVKRHPPSENIDWNVLPIYDEYTEDGWLIPRDRKPPTLDLSCDKNKSSLVEIARSLADRELNDDRFAPSENIHLCVIDVIDAQRLEDMERAVLILQACGAAMGEILISSDKNMHIVDETCAWVSKAWTTLDKQKKGEYPSINHGKYGHEEIIATAPFAGKQINHSTYVYHYVLRGELDKSSFTREVFLEIFKYAASEGFDLDISGFNCKPLTYFVDPFLRTLQKENSLKEYVSFWCSTLKGYAYHCKVNMSAWKSQFLAKECSRQNLQEQEKTEIQKIITHFKIRGRIFSYKESLMQDEFIRLRSSDVSVLRQVDSSIVDSLKVSFMSANHSLAFPYVAASEKEEPMESSLFSEFAETCGHELASKVALSKSCFLDGGEYEQLADLDSVNDYLVSRMEKKQKGQADLVVFCEGGSASERRSFTDILSSVERSGSRYTVLYVSDPLRSKLYPSYQEVARFLGESTPGNASTNSTLCDGVCQIKSSLLEGLFVGIVLLLILISGLCCMAGIDTPTRFEVPQDS